MQLDTPWTPLKVAEALVRAFRTTSGRPVWSSGNGFSLDDKPIEPFGWPERFLPDAYERRIVLTWARCMATGESVRELYRNLGWSRNAVERRRIAALKAIANGLNTAKT